MAHASGPRGQLNLTGISISTEPPQDGTSNLHLPNQVEDVQHIAIDIGLLRLFLPITLTMGEH